jgi:hypothetical protein
LPVALLCRTQSSHIVIASGAKQSTAMQLLRRFTPRNDGAVIPGHREAMSPESISQLALAVRWIPGSRYARPGMTAEFEAREVVGYTS